jgi:hypothetical protein
VLRFRKKNFNFKSIQLHVKFWKNVFLSNFFKFSSLLYNVSFDIVAAKRSAASFYLIDLSCDVLFEIRRFVASFICYNLKSRCWTGSRALRFPLDFLSQVVQLPLEFRLPFFCEKHLYFLLVLLRFSDVSSFLRPIWA